MSSSDLRSILIVEDDENIQFTVGLLLEGEGYQVASARHGLEALEYLKSHSLPHLILLDMTMPVMDGWAFADHLRRQYDHRVPILVMTAAADAAQRARDIGAEGWVSKPFSIDLLLSSVKRYM